MEFQALGKKSTAPSRDLETFTKPEGTTVVRMKSDELTSMCPITGQPDFSNVLIEYYPDQLCIESKSLKLYLWSFRDEGIFCEGLAARIAKDIFEATQAHRCRVVINQSIRGGIAIEAEAEFGENRG